jgi:hypothetical protein
MRCTYRIQTKPRNMLIQGLFLITELRVMGRHSHKMVNQLLRQCHHLVQYNLTYLSHGSGHLQVVLWLRMGGALPSHPFTSSWCNNFTRSFIILKAWKWWAASNQALHVKKTVSETKQFSLWLQQLQNNYLCYNIDCFYFQLFTIKVCDCTWQDGQELPIVLGWSQFDLWAYIWLSL